MDSTTPYMVKIDREYDLNPPSVSASGYCLVVGSVSITKVLVPYVCVCLCACMCMLVCMCVHVYMHVNVNAHGCMCVSAFV